MYIDIIQFYGVKSVIASAIGQQLFSRQKRNKLYLFDSDFGLFWSKKEKKRIKSFGVFISLAGPRTPKVKSCRMDRRK